MNVEPVSVLALWASKILGAAAGSAISVAYLLPKGRREAASRFLIGMVTGVVFGPPAGLSASGRALSSHIATGSYAMSEPLSRGSSDPTRTQNGSASCVVSATFE